jgi:hypothetical protein
MVQAVDKLKRPSYEAQAWSNADEVLARVDGLAGHVLGHG